MPESTPQRPNSNLFFYKMLQNSIHGSDSMGPVKLQGALAKYAAIDDILLDFYFENLVGNLKSLIELNGNNLGFFYFAFAPLSPPLSFV